MKLKKILITLLFGTAAAVSFSGCNLIFEPATDALDRMFYSMPTGEPRVVRELCDGEQVCGQLMSVFSIVKSEWYNAQQGFFIIKKIEIADDTGRSFVYVDLNLPDSNARTPVHVELVFEMERIKLRWHIYKVIGIDEFIRRANQARGIL